jgi:hypothetical protein
MPPKTDYTTEQAKLVRDIKKTNEEIAKLQSNLIEGDRVQLEIIAEQNKKLRDLQKIYKDNVKVINKATLEFEDMDDTLISIGNTMKTNNKLVELQSDNFTKVKLVATSIADELAKGGASNEKTQKQIIAAQNAYKNMHISIADANKEYALGRISNEERVELIKRQSESFQDMVSVIDMTKVSSEELTEQIKNMTDEAEHFGNSMKEAQVKSEKLDSIFESFEGIPALGQVNKLLKTNIKDTVAFKAAVFALGAALGKAAFDYFGAPMKAAMQQHKEIEQLGIDGEADRAKMTMDRGFIDRDAAKGYSKIQEESDNNRIDTAHNVAQAMNEAAFAGQKAANSFSASMQSGAAQFQRAAKTALFGKSIGSIGYGSAQMQLAGIGADKIASAMEAAGAATGKMPTAKAAADMAVMAERTGQSVDDISAINEAFQRMDGMSAEVAMNMQEGMRNMADQAGIGLGNLMKEVAEASKEALGYQIKSGPALAKAVAYTQSMGLNFGDVAKAGKNMVLNYKDSIKAEMQLSSMLGEQVDLAEVRAKFAAGDTEGALGSLKSQGLDPADMDQFQQQALQDALGGMDLNSLSKVANNTGKDASLSKGNAKAGNQEFLTKTQSAEATLNAQEASISAQQAIVDAKLSGQIADSFINSPGHKDYLKAQADQAIKSQQLNEEMEKLFKNSDAYNKQLTKTMQLNFVDTIKEGLMSGLAMVSGGVITSFLASKIGGGAGASAMSMITGGGGGAPAAVASPAAKAVSGVQSAAAGVGGAGGGGMGGALSGIASGLAAFANPATLVGLAAITAALVLLQPVIETMVPVMVEMARVVGEVIVKALEMAGPIITSILEGIGYVIESIGKAIAMVITAIGDSLVKIGSIDGGNLLKVAAALIPLSAGLVALGAGELIAGVLGFIGSLFGGDGPTIWEKLKELGDSGPALMQAATAVSVLAPAFAMLAQVDDGENLGALMDNLKSALTKLDDKAQATLKGLAGAMHDFGYGAYALGVVRSNPNLELLAAQIKLLLADDVTSAITKGTPIIQGLQTTLNSFNTSTMGLANSLYMVNPQLMILLNTMNTFSNISAGIDTTTLALTNMASALSEVAKINTTNLTRVPWDKMAGFSKQNGNFVLAQSANNNFNIAQESAKNLQKLATDAKANLQVSKNLQALIAVLANEQAAGTQLIIDGKAVANMLTRRDDNRRATKA